MKVRTVNGDAAYQVTGKRKRQDDKTECPILISKSGGREVDEASMAHVSRSGSAGRSSPCGFSVERLSKRNQVMQCKDFRGHSSVIRGLEFSDDGSLLLVSGGDRTVLI